jgi:flavin reductase (DIM6/NTAB) family NADH-FMN oxidoreductase RutF
MMEHFCEIRVKRLTDNFFSRLDDDWMLVTAGSHSDFNTMTASWGGFGILWNKPVAFVVIRPQRYTYEFINRSEFFTLSFFPPSFKKALQYCGSYSGRNKDKPKETGLTPLSVNEDSVAFQEASLIMVCRRLYTDHLKKENFLDPEIIRKNYPGADFHQLTIGEITDCYQKKNPA